MMSSKSYLCNKCGRSFDTRKGLLTHERTAPHFKLAKRFIDEEEQNTAICRRKALRIRSLRI